MAKVQFEEENCMIERESDVLFTTEELLIATSNKNLKVSRIRFS